MKKILMCFVLFFIAACRVDFFQKDWAGKNGYIIDPNYIQTILTNNIEHANKERDEHLFELLEKRGRKDFDDSFKRTAGTIYKNSMYEVAKFYSYSGNKDKINYTKIKEYFEDTAYDYIAAFPKPRYDYSYYSYGQDLKMIGRIYVPELDFLEFLRKVRIIYQRDIAKKFQSKKDIEYANLVVECILDMSNHYAKIKVPNEVIDQYHCPGWRSN